MKRWRVAVAEAQSEVAAASTEAAQEAARASEARLTAQRSASKAAEAERLAAELVLKVGQCLRLTPTRSPSGAQVKLPLMCFQRVSK